jgi:hypothetical protein
VPATANAVSATMSIHAKKTMKFARTRAIGAVPDSS